jgi:hypothetical protein
MVLAFLHIGESVLTMSHPYRFDISQDAKQAATFAAKVCANASANANLKALPTPTLTAAFASLAPAARQCTNVLRQMEGIGIGRVGG